MDRIVELYRRVDIGLKRRTHYQLTRHSAHFDLLVYWISSIVYIIFMLLWEKMPDSMQQEVARIAMSVYFPKTLYFEGSLYQHHPARGRYNFHVTLIGLTISVPIYFRLLSSLPATLLYILSFIFIHRCIVLTVDFGLCIGDAIHRRISFDSMIVFASAMVCCIFYLWHGLPVNVQQAAVFPSGPPPQYSVSTLDKTINMLEL